MATGETQPFNSPLEPEMPTDREILNKAVAGLIGGSSEPTGDPLAGGAAGQTAGAGRAMQRRVFRLLKPAAELAATDIMTNGVGNNATATYAFSMVVPHTSRLVAATGHIMTALTGHDTNYATINVTKDNGAGSALVVVLSNTTKLTGGLGTLAVATAINLTPSIVATSGANDIAAGQVLRLQITKAASGVVVGPLAIDLVLEEV